MVRLVVKLALATTIAVLGVALAFGLPAEAVVES